MAVNDGQGLDSLKVIIGESVTGSRLIRFLKDNGEAVIVKGGIFLVKRRCHLK